MAFQIDDLSFDFSNIKPKSNNYVVIPPRTIFAPKTGVIMTPIVTPDMIQIVAGERKLVSSMTINSRYTASGTPHHKQLGSRVVMLALAMPLIPPKDLTDPDPEKREKAQKIMNEYGSGRNIIALVMANTAGNSIGLLLEDKETGFRPSTYDPATGEFVLGSFAKVIMSASGQSYDVTQLNGFTGAKYGFNMDLPVSPYVNADGVPTTLSAMMAPYSAAVKAAWEADAPPSSNTF